MKIIPFQDLVRRYFSGEGFVLFDTETTGLNTFHDDIVEVAGMIWEKGKEPENFEELIRVNPNKMTSAAQEIHQISMSDLENARESSEVLSDFADFCDGRALIAHNVRFDFPMLNSNMIRSGLKPYPNDQVACSLAYAKEQSLPGRLSDLANTIGVEVESKNLHRALYDVELLRAVMNKMMKEHEPEEMQYSLIF